MKDALALERTERGGRGEATRDAEGEPRNVTTDADAWPLVPLKELCIPRTGVRNPADQPDEKFLYVDISAVDNQRKRIIDPQTLLGRDAPSRARNIIRTRDVVVATTRPNLNAVALVPEDLDDEICSTGFCVLRAGPRIVPEYLFAFVRSPAFVDPLTELVKGALYPAVNDGQVLALSIPLPPLAEQERIAGRLTEQLAAVERARVAAQSRLAAAESLPAAYLREVFEGPEASKWETPTIGDIAEVQGGYAFKSDWFTEDGVRILRNANIHQGFIEWDDVVFVSADRARELPSLVLAEGDIVLTLDRPIVAGGLKAARVGTGDLPALLNQRVARFNLDASRIDADYFYTFLRSQAFIGGLPKHDHSLGVPHVSPGQVGEIAVPLPPLPDQRRIAADLAARLAGAERLADGLRAELAAIDALPAALLREAFGGVHATH